MKATLRCRNGLVAALAGLALVIAVATAAWCYKCEQRMASDAHIIQIVDRLSEQQTLALALGKMRVGDLQGATDKLAARMGDNAMTIQQLVLAARDDYRSMAQALSETQLLAVPDEAPVQAQVVNELPTD